jgi:hypothetical protein
MTAVAILVGLSFALQAQQGPAARGESLAAFDARCIPAGCVAPPLNTPGILGRRALPAGRLARLGATPDFHHGLLTPDTTYYTVYYTVMEAALEPSPTC